MAALLPPGVTPDDFRRVVEGSPFMVRTTLGLQNMPSAKSWKEYIRITLKELNEKYGFTFELPSAAPIQGSSSETQSLARRVEGQISKLPE